MFVYASAEGFRLRRITPRHQTKNHIRSALILSIIIHIAFALMIMFYPKRYPEIEKDETILA